MGEAELDTVLKAYYRAEDADEAIVSGLLTTPMFPFEQDGIAPGGNTLWTKIPPSTTPTFSIPLVVPKPDYYYGYANDSLTSYSSKQQAVLLHSSARTYTQPTAANTMPAIVVEVKSEAAGGTMWHAENQAAGGGTCCVQNTEWLFGQAAGQNKNMTYSRTDSVAFSIAMCAREAALYIHYSGREKDYYMSQLDIYRPYRDIDVQRCRSTVKNIIEWMIGSRDALIKVALDSLFEIPSAWTEEQSAIKGLSRRGRLRVPKSRKAHVLRGRRCLRPLSITGILQDRS